MTNEVEELIIQNEVKDSIKYDQSLAYLFYKEIWNFILNKNSFNYNTLSISFNIVKKDNKYYIPKYSGIKYNLISKDYKYSWNTYYEGCNSYNINNLFNTNIDLILLLKLLNIDGFNYNYFEEDKSFNIYISIDKYTINKRINETLIKHKILKKEK